MAPEHCPYCGHSIEPDARTCASCDLPLLQPDHEEPARAHGSVRQVTYASRRVDPMFASGSLRVVAVAANQAEADMVESLLRSEGIPCIVRRSGGSDVPDFLAAGRRDILVPEGGLEAARDILQIEDHVAPAEGPSPGMLAAAIAGGVIFMVGAISALYALT